MADVVVLSPASTTEVFAMSEDNDPMLKELKALREAINRHHWYCVGVSMAVGTLLGFILYKLSS